MEKLELVAAGGISPVRTDPDLVNFVIHVISSRYYDTATVSPASAPKAAAAATATAKAAGTDAGGKQATSTGERATDAGGKQATSTGERAT